MILLTVALMAAPEGARGHAGFQMVPPIPGVSDVFSDTHAGYGYLSPASEAQADTDFNFGCSNNEQLGYLSAYCHRPVNSYSELSGIVTDAARSVVIQRLRQQVFEYLYLQAQVLKKKTHSRAAIAIPDCMAGGGGAAASGASGVSGAEHDRLPPQAAMTAMNFNDIPDFDPSQIDFTVEGLQEPQKSIGGRYTQISAQFAERNMLGALGFADSVQATLTRCTSDPPAATDQARQAECRELPNVQSRIRNAYPALDLDAGTRSDLQHATTLLLGTHLAPRARESSRNDRGAHFYVANLVQNGGLGFRDFDAAVNDSFKEAGRRGAPASLRRAASGARQVLQRMYAAQARQNSSDLAGMCGKSLDDLMRSYPTAMRQALLDMGDSMRGLAKTVMCLSPSLAQIRPSRNPCDGVTGGPLPAHPVQVSRYLSQYPFRSANGYTISQPTAGGPRTVDLTIHLARDSNVSEQEMAAMISRVQGPVESWYNCQTGSGPAQITVPGPSGSSAALSCPPDPSLRPTPPVSFHVHLDTTSQQEPLVHLHRCYLADLPEPDSSQCDKVIAYKVHQCAQVSDAADRATCVQHASSPDSPGREDSGNYALNTQVATVVHEAGHLMGLEDEYQRDWEPFNTVGEHDSIMNDSNNPSSRIYRRHLDQILSVGACGQPQARGSSNP